MHDFDVWHKRLEIETEEKWKDWLDKIPPIRFDPDWDVKIIPPFAGALTRFWVDHGDKHVSVYFDTWSRLGWMYDSENEKPIPYFELYPYIDGDTKRYTLDEVNELMYDMRLILNA